MNIENYFECGSILVYFEADIVYLKYGSIVVTSMCYLEIFSEGGLDLSFELIFLCKSLFFQFFRLNLLLLVKLCGEHIV